MMKSLNAMLALTPFLAMFAGYMWNYNNEVVAEVWTIDNCVMEQWRDWEDKRGTMPTISDEKTFRDACWEQMGATVN